MELYHCKIKQEEDLPPVSAIKLYSKLMPSVELFNLDLTITEVNT